MSSACRSLKRRIVSLWRGGGSTNLPPSAFSWLSCSKIKVALQRRKSKVETRPAKEGGGEGGGERARERGRVC